eukprot:TRINITY_DN2911_c0_g3_i3.p1 TRINITY_DN2911_c0_g3~~TRINITY_DN2911_c0_g3_i3.p1  ORF type:complete len:340 (-),score=50.80 TRINITY_DN2911_c0_g3_i3:335-1354(-)
MSLIGADEGSMNAAGILKFERNAGGVAEENQELEQPAKEVIQRKRHIKNTTVLSESARAMKRKKSVSSNPEDSLREPKMKSRAKRNKTRLQLQRANESMLLSQAAQKPHPNFIPTPFASTKTPTNCAYKPLDLRADYIFPKALASVSKTHFLIEKLNDKSSPKQLFSVKSSPSFAPLSLDFTNRLLQARIDKNKLISVTRPLQSILAMTDASAAKSVESAVPNIPAAADGLPLQPCVAQRFSHVHNEFCGHTRVLHDGHIDYIVNGVLHFVDRYGNVYPHKLGVTERNPVGCRPIGEQGLGIAEELVTPHVLLRGSNRRTSCAEERAKSIGSCARGLRW